MTRSDYEERKEQRKERLLDRAERAEAESSAAFDEADRIGKTIPMGQPILVGHHSERGHRADLRRIDRNMAKAVAKTAEAKELRRRAEAVGTGGISSDDPEAIAKLRSKLERLTKRQAKRKALNAAWRKAGKPAPDDRVAWSSLWEGAGMPAEDLDAFRVRVAKRWHFQPCPVPAYALRNTNAELRRLRLRIDQLERAAHAERVEVDHGVCRVIEEPNDNRVRLVFDRKPPERVRTLLKKQGFRWSRAAHAWQRHLNDAGRVAAEVVVRVLKGEVS